MPSIKILIEIINIVFIIWNLISGTNISMESIKMKNKQIDLSNIL
jgi:hypothetical protein